MRGGLDKARILRLVAISILWLAIIVAVCTPTYTLLAAQADKRLNSVLSNLRDDTARHVQTLVRLRMKVTAASANVMELRANLSRKQWQQTLQAQLSVVENVSESFLPVRVAYCAVVNNVERASFEAFAQEHYGPLLSPNVMLISENRSFLSAPPDYYYPEWILPILDVYPLRGRGSLGDFTSEPVRRQAGLEALQKGISTMSSRTVLGGMSSGVIGVHPVRATASGKCTISDGSGRWSATPYPQTNVCGLLTTTLDPTEVLLTVLGDLGPSMPVAITLYDASDRGTILGRVVYRDERWSAVPVHSGPLAESDPGPLASITIFSRRWVLAVQPLPEFQEACLDCFHFLALAIALAAGGCGVLGLLCSVCIWNRKESSDRIAEKMTLALKRRDQMVAFASHEIRNVLQSIASVQDLLFNRAKRSDDTETLKLLNDVGAVTCMAVTLLNDMLDVSRMEVTELNLVKEPFDVGPWISSLAAVMEALKKEGVQFSLVVEKDVPARAVGDKTRLAQVVTNVLMNSFKFTSQGTVKMTVRFVPRSDSQWLLVMEVVDTGDGIDPKKPLRKLSYVAGHAPGETCEDPDGTGLGLVLCKALCQKMGGAMVITSAGEGKGTHISIQVQVDTCPPESPVQDLKDTPHSPSVSLSGRKHESSSLSRRLSVESFAAVNPSRSSMTGTPEQGEGQVEIRRTLIVDDMSLNRRLLRRVLASFCPHVDEASDGKEAFEKVMEELKKDNPYELIMTDQDMPVLSGLESIRRMQDSGVTAAFVVVSGNAAVVRSLLLPGEDLCIMEKPIRSCDIATTVLPLVSKARRRARANRPKLSSSLKPITRMQFLQTISLASESVLYSGPSPCEDERPSATATPFSSFSSCSSNPPPPPGRWTSTSAPSMPAPACSLCFPSSSSSFPSAPCPSGARSSPCSSSSPPSASALPTSMPCGSSDSSSCASSELCSACFSASAASAFYCPCPPGPADSAAARLSPLTSSHSLRLPKPLPLLKSSSNSRIDLKNAADTSPLLSGSSVFAHKRVASNSHTPPMSNSPLLSVSTLLNTVMRGSSTALSHTDTDLDPIGESQVGYRTSVSSTAEAEEDYLLD